MRKNYLLMLLLCITLFSCKKSPTPAATTGYTTETHCGTYKSGQSLFTGPQGGCYYYNSNNNKTYVDRSNCSCKIY